jgi:hypothetical protein
MSHVTCHMSHLAHTPRELISVRSEKSWCSALQVPTKMEGGIEGMGREGGREGDKQGRKGARKQQGRKQGRAVTDHSTCYKHSMRAVERHLSTACPLRASMHGCAHLKGG